MGVRRRRRCDASRCAQGSRMARAHPGVVCAAVVAPAAARRRAGRQRLRRSRPARRGLGMDRRLLGAAGHRRQPQPGRRRAQASSAAPARCRSTTARNYAVLMRVAMLSSLERRDTHDEPRIPMCARRCDETRCRCCLLSRRCAAALAAPRRRRCRATRSTSLTAQLTDAQSRQFAWGAQRGQPQLVSMFYTSCKFVCPMIIDSGKAVEQSLTPRSARGSASR